MKKELTEKQKHFIKKHAGHRSPEKIAKAIRSDEGQVAEYIESFIPKLDPKKQRIFTWLMRSIPIVFILLLELALRAFRYGGDLRLFIPMKGDMDNYYQINHDVAKRYFFMQETIPSPGRDLFLKEKPKNGYRIFVLGGSTTAGYPYGNNIMFSRILGQRLADVFPQRNIEIVNVAMSAVNSYTLLDFTDEIIDRQPDCILFYAGHNEYYGAMGVGSMESLGKNPDMVRFYLKLRHFRLFLLMRNMISSLQKGVNRSIQGSAEADPTATLMARMVANKDIPLESETYTLGIQQFDGNLERILQKFQAAGVPVILSELVCNIRDQKPFISVQTKTFPSADDVFIKARMTEKQSKYAEARSLYIQAKDLDALRFRAPEAMDEVIHRLALKYHASVVPMKSVFENASPQGLVGDRLMTDHLHPNIDGYFLMADAFFKTMQDGGYIDSHWDSTKILPSQAYQNAWGITALDSAEAALSIRYLKGGWPFQPEVKVNETLKNIHPTTLIDKMAIKILTDPDVNLEKGHMELARIYVANKQYDQAFHEYKALITMVPHEIEFYEKAVEMCIMEEKYAQAFSILKGSLKLRETPFNIKWMGQLYLMQGEVKKSIPFLEKAHVLAPEDTQVLFNLGRSYVLINNQESALKIYNQLKTMDSQSKYTEVLGQMVQELQETRLKIKDKESP